MNIINNRNISKKVKEKVIGGMEGVTLKEKKKKINTFNIVPYYSSIFVQGSQPHFIHRSNFVKENLETNTQLGSILFSTVLAMSLFGTVGS